MSILVVGTVALDSIKTPFGRRDDILGGSATFFSMASSLFAKTDIIAVVGKDFPKRYLKLFRDKGIGIDGLDVTEGRTFRWKGFYEYDLNTAHTLDTQLNVIRDFKPRIPKGLRDSKYVFLANIDPELQYDVLRQAANPVLTACDSMNYWIEHKRSHLKKLLTKIDLLLLNDAEARELSGESNLLKAAAGLISLGPKSVIIKRGEYGVMYFSKGSHFVAPAYLLESVYDPTGAGDTFAGGLVGFLSKAGRVNEASMRKAIIYGSVLASFAVEDFSVNRLLKLSMRDINARYAHFRKITCF